MTTAEGEVIPLLESQKAILRRNAIYQSEFGFSLDDKNNIFGPFVRSEKSQEVVQNIIESNETWGAVRRNYMPGLYPEVKAVTGTIVEGRPNMVKFYTLRAPDPGWRPHVMWTDTAASEYAKIPVIVIEFTNASGNVMKPYIP